MNTDGLLTHHTMLNRDVRDVRDAAYMDAKKVKLFYRNLNQFHYS
jgi:hypothetical protein